MKNYDKLLDVAQDILKSKKQGVSFAELLDGVAKTMKLSNEEKTEIAADFYQSLLESNIFYHDSKTSTWGLRDNITFDSYQKMVDIYANTNDDVKESDYRSDMSQIEIAELENGNRNDKTSRLDLADDEEDDANIDPDMEVDLDDEE